MPRPLLGPWVVFVFTFADYSCKWVYLTPAHAKYSFRNNPTINTYKSVYAKPENIRIIVRKLTRSQDLILPHAHPEVIRVDIFRINQYPLHL